MSSFSVELAPAGIVQTLWNPKLRTHAKVVRQPRTATELLEYWNHALVAITPGYTLSDLFALLSIADIDALSGMLSCDMPAFIAEYQACLASTDNPQSDGLTEIRITSWVTQALEGEFSPPPPLGNIPVDYHISYDVSGIGPGEDGNNTTSYAIDFTPLKSLLHLPLVLDTRANFRNESRDLDSPLLFSARLPITFGQFIYALMWELGFHGSPVTRNERCEELKDIASTLDSIDNPSGSVSDSVYDEEDDEEDDEVSRAIRLSQAQDTDNPAVISKSSFNPHDMLAELHAARAAEPPAFRQAKDILARHGADMCQTPGVMSVIIEGREDARIIVVTSDALSIVDLMSIPPSIDGIPVDIRPDGDWLDSDYH